MQTPLSPAEPMIVDKDLGLDGAATLQLVDELKSAELDHATRRLGALREENAQLRALVLNLREESQQQRRQLDEVAALVGCTRPHKLIHDLRNILNELVLLRSALEQQD